ncbi:hypothetical protein [Aggregatilinea lenta]|uniref:hypothetical protein n=1 Tax=Aggregatilinea lenta TaxID=913108 RepID=UPI000E5B7959|nr:hypothetical protein [Aggregatilinea lenta]
MVKHPARTLLLVFLAALAVRLVFVGARYTDDLSAFQTGDYTLYWIGADHILSQGDLSNSLFLLRPPLFAAVIAVLDLDNLAVLLCNVVLGALLAPLSVILARQLTLGSRAALVVGLIVALDPASVVYSAFLGPEPLANLTFLGMPIMLLHAVLVCRGGRALLWGSVAGLLLALSTLTRPAPYLVWIPLALWLLVFYRAQWRTVTVYVLVGLIGIGAWVAHNARVFDNPTVSSVGAYSMLYYRAASVEHWGADHDMDTVYTDLARRVEARLGHDTSQVSTMTRHSHYSGPDTLTNAMTATALDTFQRYPAAYIATLPVGLARMYGYTSALPRWTRVLEVPWNLALTLGALAGVVIAARRRAWLLAIGTALPVLYYTAGTLFVQTSGMDTRMRTMLTPFLAVGLVVAAGWVAAWRSGQSEDRDVPAG